MQLIYVDESGNTGHNLDDPQQPILVVGALVVPEACWQSLEDSLEAALRQHLPGRSLVDLEIHGTDLRNGRGSMPGVPVATRIALRDAWLRIAREHHLKLIYRSIEKRLYKAWQSQTLEPGLKIHPQIAAFALVALVVNEYLATQDQLGIFVIDDSKDVGRDIERSIRQLRITSGPIKLTQIVEKGFFIDSKKSRVLQLADVCTMWARRFEEEKRGADKKSIDASGITGVRPLIHRGNEQMIEVLKWLRESRPE